MDWEIPEDRGRLTHSLFAAMEKSPLVFSLALGSTKTLHHKTEQCKNAAFNPCFELQIVRKQIFYD